MPPLALGHPWRDIIGQHQPDSLRFNLLCERVYSDLPFDNEYGFEFSSEPCPADEPLLDPEGDMSLSQTCWVRHLEKDEPEAFDSIRRWREGKRRLVDDIQTMRASWDLDFADKVIDEKMQFEAKSKVDMTGVFMTCYLWPDVLWDYLKGVPQKCSSEQYTLQQPDRGPYLPYLLCFRGAPIGRGSGQWMTRLQTLHQQIYQEEMNRLPEAIKRSGFLERCSEIQRLANDIYERLDIICSGGAVFTPGNCQVCQRLVVRDSS